MLNIKTNQEMKTQVLKSDSKLPFFEGYKIEINNEIEDGDIYYPIKQGDKIMIAHFQNSGMSVLESMVAFEKFTILSDGEEVDFENFVDNELYYGAKWETI
jgi:hypothetical protein